MNVLVKNHRYPFIALLIVCCNSAAWGQSVGAMPTSIFAAFLPRESTFIEPSISGSEEHKWIKENVGASILERVSTAYQTLAGNKSLTVQNNFFVDSVPKPKQAQTIIQSSATQIRNKTLNKGRVQPIGVSAAVSSLHLKGETNSNWKVLEDTVGKNHRQSVGADTTSSLSGCGAVSELSAPTNPVTDDDNNTFDWTYSAGYTSPELYEYTLDGGTLYQPVTAKPQPVGNNAYTVGQVGVRVKAGPYNYKSETLYNTVAFRVAAENLLPRSDFNIGFPFYLYNCTANPTKNIPSPVSNPGTYYQNLLNGTTAEVSLFNFPHTQDLTVTYSMYVKPVGLDILTLKVLGNHGPLAEATYKISTGAVGSLFNASGLVSAVPNFPGWYRVSITYTPTTSITNGRLQMIFPETKTNIQKTFYLAGAQLNRGTTSETFVPR